MGGRPPGPGRERALQVLAARPSEWLSAAAVQHVTGDPLNRTHEWLTALAALSLVTVRGSTDGRGPTGRRTYRYFQVTAAGVTAARNGGATGESGG